MQLRVRFGPLREEIEDKLASSPEVIERAFLARIERALSAPEAEHVRTGHSVLVELAGPRATPSVRQHVAHSVRIASYVLSFQDPPNPETLRIALMHNVIEAYGASPSMLETRGLTAREIDGIRRMTIDRAYESDPAYLTRFYADIEAFGPDLGLVRCIDKLDNLLGITENDKGPVFESYVALAKEFVLPIARRLDPALAAFFDDVCRYMLARMEAS